jgi:hypothetical protein
MTQICVTCGTQFPPSGETPRSCPICQDDRQFIGPQGQEWISLDDLRKTHRNVFFEKAGAFGGFTQSRSSELDRGRCSCKDRAANCRPLPMYSYFLSLIKLATNPRSCTALPAAAVSSCETVRGRLLWQAIAAGVAFEIPRISCDNWNRSRFEPLCANDIGCSTGAPAGHSRLPPNGKTD